MYQRVYNGVRLLGDGACADNVHRLDMGAIPMLSSMMDTGLQVDLAHFANMEVELERDMENLTERSKVITGHYCNLNSPEQKSELLFKKLGLKQARPKLTASGDRESVMDEVLTAIQHDHPVVPLMLEFAELSKLKGTYVTPMPKLARRTAHGTWRMYPKLGQNRVPSGRFNCKDPNLLAMPTRTKRGKDIRKGFITDSGWVIVSIDMSQIEPRVAAHRSLDPGFLNVYRNGEDVYSDFSIAAFQLQDERYRDTSGKWQYPHVNVDDHRRPSKTCVLAALYDVTGGGLLEQMPIICSGCGLEATKHTCGKFRARWTEDGCQDLLNAFYIKYPGLMDMRKADHKIARRLGYTYDLWGRVLHVTAVRSVLEWVVQGALREVGNFPMQASAGGVLKLVMAQMQDDIEEHGWYEIIHPLLPIHDELLFECRADVAEDLGHHVGGLFKNAVRFEVPIEYSSGSAESWGMLKK